MNKLNKISSINNKLQKQIWIWWSRVVYDNWDWYVLKVQRPWWYEGCNEYELKNFNLFKEKEFSHILWNIDLKRSNNDNIYMEKLNIFKKRNIKDIDVILLNSLENKSTWNKSLVMFCKFNYDIDYWKNLLSNLEYDTLLKDRLNFFENNFKENIVWDFKKFIEILKENEYLYDFFHILWWLENIWYDNKYNLKILDFWW